MTWLKTYEPLFFLLINFVVNFVILVGDKNGKDFFKPTIKYKLRLKIQTKPTLEEYYNIV